MKDNYQFTDVTEALPELLADLSRAPVVGSRAGRTREMTHIGITLMQPWCREVLVPGRKCNIAAQIAETMWVLAGRDDIEWLSHYLPRARDFSDDGKTWRGAYGARLRHWRGAIDQLAHVVDTLKANPESRQAAAVIYDPVIDSYPGKDIPCNNWLSFLIRDGALDLHVAVRSNDAMWGWSGINVFEWSALQEIVAGLVGVTVGQLHFSVTSFHLYEKHWQRAAGIILDSRMTHRVEVVDSPRFKGGLPGLGGRVDLEDFDNLVESWFDVELGIRTGAGEQNRIDNFPEPMMQSWLRVLDWWWNGDEASLAPLKGTALEAACRMGLRPAWDTPPKGPGWHHQHPDGRWWAHPVGEQCPSAPQPMSLFLDHAIRVHNEKHAAYGDSWKRRGEMLGIMANIARKIDRLGGSETADETSADTALDLMVYLAKYKSWLDEQAGVAAGISDTPDYANGILIGVEKANTPLGAVGATASETYLEAQFEALEKVVTNHPGLRATVVDDMLVVAYRLARYRYEANEHAGDQYLGADHD